MESGKCSLYRNLYGIIAILDLQELFAIQLQQIRSFLERSLFINCTLHLNEHYHYGHSADDYIQALIQQDKAHKDHLKALILERLDSGEATPMTDDDGASLRTTVHV